MKSVNCLTHSVRLGQKPQAPSFNAQVPQRGIPPSDVLELRVRGPIPQRPFEHFLDDVLEAGFCDPSLDAVLYSHRLTEALAAFDGKSV